MGEAMGLRDLFLGTMAGAVIVLAGASYALFFALGRLHERRSMLAVSLASFGLLVAASAVLIDALALRGIWMAVIAVMLVGYFLLPRAIWNLCVGTHGDGVHSTPFDDTHSRADR